MDIIGIFREENVHELTLYFKASNSSSTQATHSSKIIVGKKPSQPIKLDLQRQSNKSLTIESQPTFNLLGTVQYFQVYLKKMDISGLQGRQQTPLVSLVVQNITSIIKN